MDIYNWNPNYWLQFSCWRILGRISHRRLTQLHRFKRSVPAFSRSPRVIPEAKFQHYPPSSLRTGPTGSRTTTPNYHFWDRFSVFRCQDCTLLGMLTVKSSESHYSAEVWGWRSNCGWQRMECITCCGIWHWRWFLQNCESVNPPFLRAASRQRRLVDLCKCYTRAFSFALNYSRMAKTYLHLEAPNRPQCRCKFRWLK